MHKFIWRKKKRAPRTYWIWNYTTSISENLVLGQLVCMVTDPMGSHVFMCVCDGRQTDDYLVLWWCVNLYVIRGVDSSERIQWCLFWPRSREEQPDWLNLTGTLDLMLEGMRGSGAGALCLNQPDKLERAYLSLFKPLCSKLKESKWK